jgi:2-polyprenyl-3-methyl-5-hydroxy-6-metoxy-1,4-benzoquinol methylase
VQNPLTPEREEKNDMTQTTSPTEAIDGERLDEFVGRFAADLGAVLHCATVLIGDRLGLYRAMADCHWLTADELAECTGTHLRYVREWLASQAASGYADYDPSTGRFRLTPEQAFALTSEDNPLFAPGGLQVAASTVADVALIAEAFRSGQGMAWGEHHPDLVEGTLRFFRPNYIGNLTQHWIPALDGVEAKLRSGASVADIGCGCGASTIIMARAYPASRFVGFDYHEGSIVKARQAAVDAGVAERCRFDVATAKDFQDGGYDLVTVFDALHDMGDPTGVAAHVLDTLAPGGAWMIVEPFAEDRLEDNLNPVGRIFYSASTTICLPVSRSQEVDAGLGAQAGEAKLREVVSAGGFTRFQRVAATPFNLVFEARP